MALCIKKTSRRALATTAGYAGLFLGLAALLWHGLYGPRGWFALRRMEQEVQEKQRQVQQLQQQNAQLGRQIQELKNDPAAIERLARQRMGLVRPGELVFKLPAGLSNPAPKAPAAPSPAH